MLFGTTDGQLIIMSASGVMLSQITIHETVEVVSMVWACEKFYLSEQDVNSTTTTSTAASSTTSSKSGVRMYTLAEKYWPCSLKCTQNYHYITAINHLIYD